MAGFSMGGASAWSYIVHFADRWAAGAPGAGFTETAVFLRGALRTQPQNDAQQKLWHLYDATDYAVNTFNVPVIAYSGANDAQKQAADAMADAMRAEGLTLEHVIGPNTGHSYEAGARQTVQDRLDAIVETGTQRGAERDSIHDVDAPLQQDVLGHGGRDRRALGARACRREDRRRHDHGHDDERHARCTSRSSRAQSPFTPGTRPALKIDGTTLTLPAVGRDNSLTAGLVRADGAWRLGELPASDLRKRHELQGPIDDAFMDAFVFVRPTGKPLSDGAGKVGE